MMDISGIKKTGLLKDFNEEGHWYSSYPSLNHWTEEFGHTQFTEAMMDYLDHEKWWGGIHLYIHIPFCAKLCHYCICNIVITNEREKIRTFIDHLTLEIENLRAFYEKQGKVPKITEIHLGGGTPNHLPREEFARLIGSLCTLVDFSKLTEFAMEIDPRLLKEGDLQFYASHGVTRISFGVQDFDEKVQKAINREQPFEMVKEVMKERHLFRGVNFDLLYGLPFQTHETVKKTLDQTVELSPDRITLLKYCHAPEVRKHMKLIKVVDLPPKEDLGEMFVDMTQKLMDSGYDWIGLDHFAKTTDSLSLANKKNNLVRTFNGYKPGPVNMMIGLGPTATSALYDTYAQNHYDLNQYYKAVKERKFPIERGYKLPEHERYIRLLIFDLLCNLKCPIHLDAPYWREIGLPEKLEEMEDLVEMENHYPVHVIKVKPYGRVLLRNICKLFDDKDVLPEHMKIAQKTITRRAA